LFASFISLFLILFSTLIVIDKPLALFFYFSATSGILIFTWFKFQGTLRHHGNLFIIFLVSIWISRCFRESYNIPKRFHQVASYLKKSEKSYCYYFSNSDALRHICLYYGFHSSVF